MISLSTRFTSGSVRSLGIENSNGKVRQYVGEVVYYMVVRMWPTNRAQAPFGELLGLAGGNSAVDGQQSVVGASFSLDKPQWCGCRDWKRSAGYGAVAVRRRLECIWRRAGVSIQCGGALRGVGSSRLWWIRHDCSQARALQMKWRSLAEDGARELKPAFDRRRFERT